MTTHKRPVPGDTPPAERPPPRPLAPGDPPEWEPDDARAQAIAEQYAEAAAEMDTWHDHPA